jgi:hypothetical protein
MEHFINLEQAFENAELHENDEPQEPCECAWCTGDDNSQMMWSGFNDEDPTDIIDHNPDYSKWLDVQAEAAQQMWFDRAMQAVLGEALDIATQRGGEYQDSWSLENQHTPHMDMVIKHLVDIDFMFLEHKYAKRLLMLAAICDIKLSRLGGGFKDDTIVDGINYQAALLHAMRSIEEDKDAG